MAGPRVRHSIAHSVDWHSRSRPRHRLLLASIERPCIAMSLRLWFIALAHSALGQYMQNSKWGFAVVETFHLVALAILGGCVLFVDLRLLGLILKGESAPVISRDLSRILLTSLVVMIVSGFALVSE